MGGILLPGQENKPQGGGGGIELPKGFARKREEEAGPQEEAQVTPEEQGDGEQGPRGRGMDLLFPPTGAQVQCPSCGTPYVVPVFSIIDLGANPELLGALLGGQVNVAVCQNCGAGGALGAPLLVHDPGHEFLGVYTPPTGIDDMQRQKIIGDLTQMLMRKLPQEQRRGYMLQPKQYMDWQRFMERLWEFQGVTPEMLRRQRQQTDLLQNLTRLADDEQALDLMIERNRDLIDRQFFALLDRLMVMVSTQGDPQTAQQMMNMRSMLLDKTEAGRQVKALQDKIRAVLESIPQDATREDVLDKILGAWEGDDGREVATSIAVTVAQILDYQFLLAVAERLEKATDPTERERLEELRALVLELQEQQRQNAQSVMAEAQEVLQAILEAPDTDEALRQNADLIDEAFLGLLAGNIDRAEKGGAKAAANRLRQIYDGALDILQERMPPELRLVNQLVNAPDKGAIKKLLEANRSVLNRDFIESLRALEDDFRGRGSVEVADKLKSIRAQAQLMM
ncbi:MAG: hypothetical protein IPK16_32045 [Anaerolineales bacterium]|nr:hypothetical protein [Anaerolineales bacterium]